MVIVILCVIVSIYCSIVDIREHKNCSFCEKFKNSLVYVLSAIMSILIGCMICCILQLMLPRGTANENYTVSDVYFSKDLDPSSLEGKYTVDINVKDSNGNDKVISCFMSNVRVDYSESTSDVVITKYKAYSFNKWYRYIYDSPNGFYYVVTFPLKNTTDSVDNVQDEAITTDMPDTVTTESAELHTTVTETTTATESTTETTATTGTTVSTTSIIQTTATTNEVNPSSTKNNLKKLGNFTGTYYAGKTVPCRGGSGRTLIDCTVGSNGIKGSVASRYIYKNYGYNRNGWRTKIYIEFASIPSMNGWYYVDDCNAENSIIDFYFYYNSNCPWRVAGVTTVKAYI